MADVTGERGDTGDVGASGERGDKGQMGQMGVQGERGPKGDHGQPGEDAAKGEKGETGDRGETGKPGWRGFVGYLFLCAAFILIGLGFYQLTNRLEEQSLANCRGIELIKTEGRTEAKADFDRLPDTFRSLGLEYTVAYQKITQDALRRKLVRYAADTCPRKPIPTKEAP